LFVNTENLKTIIKIRNVEIDDVEALNKVIDEVSRERQYLATTSGFPLENHMQFVQNNLQNDIPQLVSIINDEIIGWCDILPKRPEEFSHVGYLGMGVLKKFRKNGVGSQLLSTCIEEAKAYGFEKIELEVFSDNFPAVKMYEKFGFKKEGLKIKSRKLDGKYQDILLLSLWLKDSNKKCTTVKHRGK